MNALSPNRLARLAVYEMAMGGSPCRNMLESFAQLCKEADLPPSKATVWWDFEIFGIKLKRRSKRPWCGEQGSEAWLMARPSFARVMKTFAPQHCVFIDECYLSTNDLKNVQSCLPAHEPIPINDPRSEAKCHIMGVIGYDGFRLFINLHDHSTGPGEALRNRITST